MVKRFIQLFIFMVALPLTLSAQWQDQIKPLQPPRFMLGADYGLFRISLREFEDMYSSRWGSGLGGFVGVRVYAAYYLTVKYGYFNQKGRTDSADPDYSRARWREQWYKVGARIHPLPDGKWNSYYGFGLAFYDIKETENLSVFLLEHSDKAQDIGSGFYMDLGVEYFVQPEIALFVDVEVASGGVRGRTGFEAMSIGGWRFSAGVSFWPF